MTIPFEPAILEDIRDHYGFDSPRAIELIWQALSSIEKIDVQKPILPTTSAERTLQILKQKYNPT